MSAAASDRQGTLGTLGTLLALDGKLVLRHRFVHVVVFMAVLFGLLVRFAVPETIGGEKQAIVLGQAAAGAEVPDNVRLVTSREELDQALDEDAEALGVVLEEDGVAAVLRGYEDARVRSLTVGAARVVAARVRGMDIPQHYQVTSLREPTPPPPLNGSVVPLLFAADIVMLGFLFGAVMVLQEKGFGTLQVYRVAPCKPPAYVGSKLLVNLGMAALGTAILVGIAMPAALANPGMWALVLGAAAGITLLGMGMAVFFPNLSAFFYPLILVSMALSVPMAAYFLPSMNVPVLQLLPTYHVMFGVRELLFPAGKAAIVNQAFLGVAVFLVLAAIFALIAVSKRLFEEAR